jgi:polyisoprenoid-binding protein YceI
MKNILKSLTIAWLVSIATMTATAQAADYVIDNKGAHASINFRVKHLGYSWVTGRFDKFSGQFSFDENAPDRSSIKVEIDTNSVNSNQADRDKHLRSGDFLDVAKFPTASFESTSFEISGKSAVVHGKLTLHGVTRDIAIKADYVGGGKDPWGGVRAGFVGSTKIALADFGIKFNLGPASKEVELNLNIEGIQKK